MSGVISAVTSPSTLIIKLREMIKKWKKKKKTESRFVQSFENEIKVYLKIFNEVSDIAENQILPIIESIGPELTVHKMNELVESMAPLPLAHAKLIAAFTDFARACSEVSAIKGFMEDLKESNIVLYDFVLAMKNVYVPENKVIIDGRYYRFFKTYEDEIFKGVEIEDLDSFVEEIKGYVRKINHYVKKTALIKRPVRKRYAKNMRILADAARNMTLKRSRTINLRLYAPRKLLPIAVLLEELS